MSGAEKPGNPADRGPGPRRRARLVGRLKRGDPALADPLLRLRRERWHLWQVIFRVYAGENADPSMADAWRRDAETGGLPGRLQLGFLEEALDRLAEIEAGEGADGEAEARA